MSTSFAARCAAATALRVLGVAGAALACFFGAASCATSAPSDATTPPAARRPRADADADAVFGGKLPEGYRDWKLISVAHEEGDLNDLRAVLGNDVAIKAYRNGTLPFPDGAIIARLAWRHTPSAENNQVFGRAQSFVAGPPVNGVQFMVKDWKRFPQTSGWGFAQFIDGKPMTDKAKLADCFFCHQPLLQRDLVFTKYSP